MNTSIVTITLPKEGGRKEYVLEDYWYCKNILDFTQSSEKLKIHVKYLTWGKYKIIVDAKEKWLSVNETFLKYTIPLKGKKGNFKIDLTLGEEHVVGVLEIKEVKYAVETPFTVKWGDKPDRIDVKGDIIQDACCIYHYKPGDNASITAYKNDVVIGELNIAYDIRL